MRPYFVTSIKYVFEQRRLGIVPVNNYSKLIFHNLVIH